MKDFVAEVPLPFYSIGKVLNGPKNICTAVNLYLCCFLITDKLEGTSMPSVESMQGNSDGEGNGTDTPYSIEAQVSSFAGVIFLTSTPRMIICFIKSY